MDLKVGAGQAAEGSRLLERIVGLHNYRAQQHRMSGVLRKRMRTLAVQAPRFLFPSPGALRRAGGPTLLLLATFATRALERGKPRTGTLSVLYPKNDTIFKQAVSLLRYRTSGENPIWSTGGFPWSSRRHYKSKPTHGIGRYKHLITAQEPIKKRGKVAVRPINLGTDYEYGVMNIHLTAYDMALAESYAQYVHKLCNDLAIKVEESYALPTKTMEVLQLQDQGNKMFLDSVLSLHERVVQVSGLSATFAEIFLEIIRSNLPEGVKLLVKEHSEEDFKGRFKARPELEELLAKLN
ncbi:large ribosomal subunit protein mL48 [Rhynchocyon petersi]